ncbi:MAG: SET domain-containing protein-lysine N-methyltransferase [Gammaproteobacteria bacterium]|nr:SET domain-containing protein-lysine N-methyltransferase [Gammaproteobacteria bacterium]
MPEFFAEHFFVSDSKISGAGSGLFARVNIEATDTIGHYTGEIVNDAEVDNEPYLSSDYILWVCTDHNIVGEGPLANYTRYINHSEQANGRIVVSTRWKKARIEAIKTIHPGDEILIDYGPSYWEAKKYNETQD